MPRCRSGIVEAHQLLPFRGTEDVFQALEDNQVVLSTMKASHFVRAFEKEVDRWERRLSLVMEVIEMILTVQRQWIYLEVRPDHPSGFTPPPVPGCRVPLLTFWVSEPLEYFSRQRHPGAAAT